MAEIDDLALTALDLITPATETLKTNMRKAGMPESDITLLVDLLSLQVWADHVAAGFKVSIVKGKDLIDRITNLNKSYATRLEITNETDQKSE